MQTTRKKSNFILAQISANLFIPLLFSFHHIPKLSVICVSRLSRSFCAHNWSLQNHYLNISQIYLPALQEEHSFPCGAVCHASTLTPCSQCARASRRKQHQKLPQGEDAELKGSEVLINALTMYSLLLSFFHVTFSSNLTTLTPFLPLWTSGLAPLSLLLLKAQVTDLWLSMHHFLCLVKKDSGDCSFTGQKSHMESFYKQRKAWWRPQALRRTCCSLQ